MCTEKMHWKKSCLELGLLSGKEKNHFIWNKILFEQICENYLKNIIKRVQRENEGYASDF